MDVAEGDLVILWMQTGERRKTMTATVIGVDQSKSMVYVSPYPACPRMPVRFDKIVNVYRMVRPPMGLGDG